MPEADLVASLALSSAFSSDELSSSEGTGEKAEPNEDDGSIKSQEVRTGFHIYFLKITSRCVMCLCVSFS